MGWTGADMESDVTAETWADETLVRREKKADANKAKKTTGQSSRRQLVMPGIIRAANNVGQWPAANQAANETRAKIGGSTAAAKLGDPM